MTSKVIEHADERGDIIYGDDGFAIFWPKGFIYGAFTANDLRELADELDRRNADWDKQMQDYFNEGGR